MLQSAHATLQFEHLHVDGRLLASESSDLLLETGVLLFLVREVALDIFLHLEKLVCEGLSDVLCLESERGLQLGLFLLEDNNLLFVKL